MPPKNPPTPPKPPLTGAAQSVSNERVREMFKGRPEPVAPPAKEGRKNFRNSKPEAQAEEPETDGVEESSAEPEKTETDGVEEDGEN